MLKAELQRRNYAEEKAREALRKAGGDVELACEILEREAANNY